MIIRHTSTNTHRCPSIGQLATQAVCALLAFSLPSSVRASRHDTSVQAVLPFDPSLNNPPFAEPPAPADHVFTLRHVFHHGTKKHPKLHRRQDIGKTDNNIWLAAEDGEPSRRLPPLTVRSSGVKIQRLVDRRPSVVDPLVATAREHGYMSVLSADAWTTDEILGPDVTQKETVLSLAYMSANAYADGEDHPEWTDVGEPFNRSASFGWEDDGLRGHVFADADNSTIVIGLKGTSMAVFDGEGTTTNDKVNDNLFFSCCCAQQGPWLWHQVCDCATGTYSCNNTCVVQALRNESRYYMAARELYSNVTELYPNSNIWITGHSLGGAVSSLLGLTYGHPVVTFEAVPEALAASRLGLPIPPGSDPNNPQTRQDTAISHFGHTADPVYVGTCNGATASCSYGGYAMETACHAGRECVYDTVLDKGWRVGIGTHKIRSVIKDVILKYDTVPECVFTPECRDCANWKMYESNGTESTTTTTSSSTSSKPRTRTQTCQTPGWWGCLDESTTTGATTTTTTTTTSSSTSTTTTTSTCKTPGWFGCKDKTTNAAVSTTYSSSHLATPTETATTTTRSSSCETPGRFWGCKDQVSTTSAAPAHSITTPPRTSAFGTTTLSSARQSSSTSTTTTSMPSEGGRCVSRAWYGWCRQRNKDAGQVIVDEI